MARFIQYTMVASLSLSCQSVRRPSDPRPVSRNPEPKIGISPIPGPRSTQPSSTPPPTPSTQVIPRQSPIPEPLVGGSPGCQVDTQDTGLKNASVMVGSTQRTFIRVVHASYSRNKKHAVVIGYHGLGLDGTSPRYHHKWPLVEEMAGDQAIFIYPNALGGSWSAGGSSSRDVLFFDELVKNTGELYCIDKNRVFVHGFSNGSFFVNGLVALRKASIRGVISVAGGGGGTKIPAMIIHGTQDQTVSYNNAPSTVTAYARANGCAVPINFNSFAPDSCQLLAGCPQELPVWFCTWNGNHHWPEFTLPDVWKFISSFK